MLGRVVQTIYGVDGEHLTPYMTRVVLGRLRLHIFHRGDADPDPHDHPWGFWTFPLTPYAEEVTVIAKAERDYADVPNAVLFALDFESDDAEVRVVWQQIVPAWRLSHRPATHTHRVISRVRDTNKPIWDPDGFYEDPKVSPQRWEYAPGPIITIVWTDGTDRPWGFLKTRDGRWCWQAWRQYVYEGGKHAPCEPKEDSK